MRITTNKSAKALKWVRIKSAFYSKGLFFPIGKLLTSKSALQDSVYGPTDFTVFFRHRDHLRDFYLSKKTVHQNSGKGKPPPPHFLAMHEFKKKN